MKETDDNTQGEVNEVLYRKYQQVIIMEFASNRKRPFNPNALFFYAFTDGQADTAVRYIREVLERHARPHFVVDCSGKRHRQIEEEIVGQQFGRQQRYELRKKLKETMQLGSGASFVFKMPSLIEGETMERRLQIVRGLMRILDDAHIDGINTMSDVIVIDRASFLENGWDCLSSYVTCVPPIVVGIEDLRPELKHSESHIWPVED